MISHKAAGRRQRRGKGPLQSAVLARWKLAARVWGKLRKDDGQGFKPSGTRGASGNAQGYGFDICPIVQNVHGKRMPGTMPAYMFVYPGSLYPTLY